MSIDPTPLISGDREGAPMKEREEGERRDYLVYSIEHGAWWRENRCGYTTDIFGAGLYTRAEAEEIARYNTGRDEKAIPVAERGVEITARYRTAKTLYDALTSSSSTLPSEPSTTPVQESAGGGDGLLRDLRSLDGYLYINGQEAHRQTVGRAIERLAAATGSLPYGALASVLQASEQRADALARREIEALEALDDVVPFEERVKGLSLVQRIEYVKALLSQTSTPSPAGESGGEEDVRCDEELVLDVACCGVSYGLNHEIAVEAREKLIHRCRSLRQKVGDLERSLIEARRDGERANLYGRALLAIRDSVEKYPRSELLVELIDQTLLDGFATAAARSSPPTAPEHEAHDAE